MSDMDPLRLWVDIAKSMGLKGDALGDFLEKKGQEFKEAREKEIQREREDREKEIQRELEKEQRQREERERDKEREHVLKMRAQELEIELARQRAAPVHNTNEHNGAIKNIKIQPFDAKTESIEKFIRVFETHMKMVGVAENQWSIHLYQAMRGGAREALACIENSEGLAYSELKKKLLVYFNKTEDYYRIQFNTRVINKSDDPQNFVANLKSDLMNWIEMSEIKHEFGSMLELLLVDKVLNMVTPELYAFIKGRKIYKEKDLVKALADFKDSHPNSNLAKNETSSGELFVMRGVRQRHSSLPSRMDRFRKPGTFGIKCWSCGDVGHTQARCNKKNQNDNWHRNNQRGFRRGGWFNRSGRGRINNNRDCHVIIQSDRTSDYSPESRGDRGRSRDREESRGVRDRSRDREELRSGHREVSRDARNRSRNREEIVSTVLDNTGTLVLYPAFVNNQITHMLKDSGCSTVAVRNSLIKREDMTDNRRRVRLGDGSVVDCRTSFIDIDTPWVKGRVEALVMESLPAPLVLGNIPEMIQDNYDKLLTDWMDRKQAQFKIMLPGKHVLCGMSEPETDVREVSLVHEYNMVDSCSVMTRAQQKYENKERKVEMGVSVETIMNVTKEQIIAQQQDDAELNVVKEKARVSKNKGFFYIQGVLAKRNYNIGRDNKPEYRVVVPRTLKKLVLKAAHEIPLAAHMGHNKTWQRLSRHFYWPKMHEDIKSYVKACQICCRHNSLDAKHKAPLQPMDLALGPFQKIAVDIIGPTATMTDRKHRYMLVIVDMCSRWIEAIPLKNILADTICHAMLGVFTKFGFPEKILSDNGTQFRSQLTAAFAEMLQITQIFAARYHPQSNGAVERANRTVKTMLRKVVQDKERDWDRFLPMVVFAYNETPHEATNFSPFQLIFGANPRGPLDILKNEIITPDVKNRSAYDMITETREEIAYSVKEARHNLEKSSERQRTIKNKHRFLRQLDVGDKVLVYLPNGSSGGQSWQGPYTVEEKLSHVDYRVNIKGNSKTFHIDLLRQYYIDLVMSNIAVEENSDNVTIHTVEMGNSKDSDIVNAIKFNKDIASEVKKELIQLIGEYKDVISELPGQTNVIQHEIKVNSDSYLKQKPYQVPYHYRKDVEKEIQLLLDNGLIQKSQSPYASPIVIVKKKNGKIRLCCDFRKINQITVIDREPLPNPEDLVNNMADANIFSHLDCTRGFYQIRMKESSKKYTAFTTHEGLYEWNVMPFGLVNSTATFVKMMNIILHKEPCIRHYVDDICVYTRSWGEHIKTLKRLFGILRKYNITVSPEKVKIGLNRLDFLGYNIGQGQIQPTKELAKKILDIEKPKTKKNVRSLIGLCSFYRSFIPNFAEVVEPLGKLANKDSPANIVWTEECEVALSKIKAVFQNEAILKPIDLNRHITLATDASRIGVGACLMQLHNGQFQPVLYLSRKLSEAEKRYSVIEIECLAIFWAVTRLQKYLLGTQFDILVDHKPLVKFNCDKVKNNRVTRWALVLQDYKFQIRSIKGCDNHIPDILSRMGNDYV